MHRKLNNFKIKNFLNVFQHHKEEIQRLMEILHLDFLNKLMKIIFL